MKSVRTVVIAFAALVLGALGTRALASGTCARPTSFLANWSGLNHFCADEPALASEMNQNFATVVSWVEAKTGPVGSALTLPGTPVNSGNIADGTISSADIANDGITSVNLAPGAVGTRELADGGVTPSKLANRVAIYVNPSNCVNPGTLSTSPTCSEVYTPVACVGGQPCSLGSRYTACDGSCTGSCFAGPLACTRPTSLLGFLVAP
jgi:hypothetical protein